MASTIELENTTTVGILADKLMIPVTRLISELMKNGIMATINERLDFETAQIIVSELGLDIELVLKEDNGGNVSREKRKTSNNAPPRPPVVAVMGHVDHGKTSLLDAIRKENVASGEAGGITQHIAAYQIKHDNRLVTILDTPGHEAFAALREHGAQLTDVVILVVAADDGIKPQSIEAIRFAKKAGVKIVVAITKTDKPEADPNRARQQLSEQDLLVEEWGGDTIAVNVSSKTGEGISELLDMVFLVSDLEELHAEQDVPAEGLIIESHMEQGRGPSAIALVEIGTLNPGDFVVAGSTYARVRNLESTDGNIINNALPSSPVLITGFKSLPEFGDSFTVVKDEKSARNLAASNQLSSSQNWSRSGINSGDLIRMIDRKNELVELNVVVKADVRGSMTSVVDSLKSLGTSEVAVKIVGSGVGPINENDVHLAKSSNAIIYGFNVNISTGIKQRASRDKVPVRLYKIIYELIDDAKEELSLLLSPEVKENELGRLIIKGVFKTTKTEVICGGEVTKGKLTVPALARILRDGEIIAEAELVNIKRGPQDAKEVLEGEMCGVSLKTTSRVDVQAEDRIEAYTRQEFARKL